MLRSLFKISVFVIAILFSMIAGAREMVPPSAHEVVIAPEGYENCYVVNSDWYQDAWTHKHRVCQYSRFNQTSIWVDGYWRCNRYNRFNNNCKHWQWVRNHWSREGVVY